MRGSVFALALITLASPARAQTTPRLSVGAFGGYATEGRNIAIDGASSYRLGFGARVGVSVPKLYVGLVFTHHLGTHDVISQPGLAYDARYNTTLFGPEVGYDAWMGTHFMLRPYLGGGPLYEHSRSTINGAEVNKSNWRVQLNFGFLAAYHFGHAFVGLDLRGVISPLSDATRWTPGAFATVGYAF